MRSKNDKKPSRPRPLRKEKLVKAAETALAEMVNLSPKTDVINISNLAKRIGVTRQAIYDNKLQDKIIKFAELQRKNFSINKEAAILRRPLEERIEILQKQNEELEKKLDGWIERWVAVEYNARLYGWNADLLFAPIPLPLRKTLIFKKKW
jgi:hypothetical protein